MRAKLRDLQRHGEIVLKEREIPEYRNDTYCLLNKHFGVTRADILLRGEEDLPDEKVMAFWKDVQARGDRTPLQHLLGSWEFMGLPFAVSPDVLIPRAETEWLVEYVLKHYQGKAPKVLDLCTGSGCIGLAIKKLLPEAEVTLVDVSTLALKVAETNRKNLEVEAKIEHWDILQGVPFFLQKERYDIIVSNPPYIKTEDLPTLQPEVQQEPELALDGGADGLLYYRALAAEWTTLLAEGGRFLVETGEDTGAGVQQIFEEVLPGATLHKDLAGLPRYVIGVK
ncbi:MAG: peptide chain release factor N(5)-glutamine methyltransferase [Clostridia bacterium]|nr:peptide chain release factor N(5)-glutamine methyltransferase [Clostridia bacterium]